MESYEEQISKLIKCVEDLRSEVKGLKSQVKLGSKPSYTNEDVLEIFGVSKPQLKKWRDEGLLGYSMIGRVYQYSPKDISDFLSSNHYEAFAA